MDFTDVHITTKHGFVSEIKNIGVVHNAWLYSLDFFLHKRNRIRRTVSQWIRHEFRNLLRNFASYWSNSDFFGRCNLLWPFKGYRLWIGWDMWMMNEDNSWTKKIFVVLLIFGLSNFKTKVITVHDWSKSWRILSWSWFAIVGSGHVAVSVVPRPSRHIG
mgnify:CR=1 FL=1